MPSEFIIAARAKGLSETALLLGHTLPLALLPVVSYAGPLLADLLFGSFVIETIFQIPGLGAFFVTGHSIAGAFGRGPRDALCPSLDRPEPRGRFDLCPAGSESQV